MRLNNLCFDGKTVNIAVENGIIKEISSRPYKDGFDCHGDEVIAGFIDVHTHGLMGIDTMDGDYKSLCRFYAQHGTTSFLPTTMTEDVIKLRSLTESPTDFDGANILGFHLEGPYISPLKKGAQNEKYIKSPDYNEFKSFKNVKMITVAPEVDGALEFIKRVSNDCAVALGHTSADYDCAVRAFDAGAVCLTHTFNAMPAFLHRDTGPIGAAFMKNAYAQLICDGFHVSQAAVLALYKLFGADRVVLISDSIKPAGMPDGEYELGGLTGILKDGAVRLKDGTIAGSIATLHNCVKKAIEFGIPKSDAVKMATETPAKLLKINKGRVEAGYDADLLIMDKDFNIKSVIIGGKFYKG